MGIFRFRAVKRNGFLRRADKMQEKEEEEEKKTHTNTLAKHATSVRATIKLNLFSHENLKMTDVKSNIQNVKHVLQKTDNVDERDSSS